jgi:uncharacterized protein
MMNNEEGNDSINKDEIITKSKKFYSLSDKDDGREKYPINSKNFERLEIISVLLEATEKMQKPFLDRALKNNYLDLDFPNRSKENLINIVNNIIQKADSNL